jgi:hypothetical protein
MNIDDHLKRPREVFFSLDRVSQAQMESAQIVQCGANAAVHYIYSCSNIVLDDEKHC